MMSDQLTTFRASLYKIIADREGEARVIFEVPLSDLAAVTKLYLAIGKLLEITVRVES